MQLPFVQHVVRYCQSVGFWGFCGIDVLFDENGQGYLVGTFFLFYFTFIYFWENFIVPFFVSVRKVLSSFREKLCLFCILSYVLHLFLLLEFFYFDFALSFTYADINPRVTGSSPALMALHQLNTKYGYRTGLFRRSGKNSYLGPPEQLLKEVDEYNSMNDGTSRIIVHSLWEQLNGDGDKTGITKVNLGVYGNDLDEYRRVLNTYAKPRPQPTVAKKEEKKVKETKRRYFE